MHFIQSARTYLARTRAEIASDRDLYLWVAAYVAVVTPFAGFNPGLIAAFFGVGVIQYCLLLPALFGLVVGARLLAARPDARGLTMRIVFGPHRMGRYFAGTVFLVATALFQATFTTAKLDFSQLSNGFPYDRVQAEIDRLIHFGVDPFHYLYAFAKNDSLLTLTEFVYNRLWFLVIFGVLFLVAISPRARTIRSRYVLSYILTWGIVGTLIAGLFHSAGPVFYHLATGDTSRFAEQLQFLGDTVAQANSTLHRANTLWYMRAESLAGVGGGISAFPSIHVAITALNAFFAFEVDRRLGVLATAFLGVIMLASVYLGWHYAIDGYASVVIVAGIYFGVRHAMSRRWRLWARTAAAAPAPIPAGD